MTMKRALLVSVPIFALIGGATALLLTVWSAWSEGRVLSPPPAVLLPPEIPAKIMISCERGEEFGWTTYPNDLNDCGVRRCRLDEVSDVAPQAAIFARCKPDQDFAYDVQSTKAEIMAASRRTEIAFVLTEAGQVQMHS